MSLGITLLSKLGLTKEEAEHINDQQNTNYVFARDQSGIGFTTPKLSLLPNLDNTYARLASISILNKEEAPKIEIKPIQNRCFIPHRLKKKDIKSISNDDFSSIFIQSGSTSDKLDSIANDIESPRKKRHHRHHQQKEEEEEQNSPCRQQIESPVADNIPNSTDNNNNQTIESSCLVSDNKNNDEHQESVDANNEQKKHRRRRHRNKNEQKNEDNS